MPKQTLPYQTNMLIALVIICFHIYALAILPLLLLPLSPWWTLSLLPLIWLHVTHWGLIHEAIHKHLHPNVRINEYAGRVLSILMGVSFGVLRFGHLIHHKLNRDWQSEYVKKNNASEKAKYYFTLLGGLYFSEIFTSTMLTLLNRRMFLGLCSLGTVTNKADVVAAGDRIFYEKNNVSSIRKDFLLVVLVYLGAFALYKSSYPILLGFILSRALMVSFMDNIYHYGTAADNSEVGKNLHLPGKFAKILLNSNYHEIHHRNPQLAWVYLPNRLKEEGRAYDGSFLKHGLMQFNGPIPRIA